MTMREYMNIIEEQKLMEAPNYASMFDSMLRVYEKLGGPFEEEGKDAIKKEISWAKKTLKKNDRIIWYLRWAKILMLYSLARSEDPKIDDDVKKQLQKVMKKFERREFEGSLSPTGGLNLNIIRTTLQHYMSMDQLTKVQNHTWGTEYPDQLFDLFAGYEEEWKETTGNTVEIQETDQELIKLGKQSWWLLGRNYCSAEADAMGHCGNAGSTSNERIISFRTQQTPELWKPHLTFILDDAGYIGESKGRSNEKPAAKYHPAIIELLKHDMVKGIKGGGYLPEENFHMEDLPGNTQEELYKLKPGLAPIQLMRKYLEDGQEKILIDRILENTDHQAIYDEERKLFKVEQWDDMGMLINHVGDDAAKDAWGVVGDGDHYDAGVTVSNDDVKMFIQDMPRDLEDILEAQLNDDVPGAMATEGDDIFNTMFRHHDELMDSAKHAIEHGHNVGGEKLLLGGLKAALAAPQTEHGGEFLSPENWFDDPVYYALNIDDIMGLMADEYDLERLVEDGVVFSNYDTVIVMDERQDYEYDEDAAYEAFRDHL